MELFQKVVTLMRPKAFLLFFNMIPSHYVDCKPYVLQVKVLYMRNLMLSTPEAVIRDIIETHAQVPKAAIEKVKKLKDFAFLHFTDRQFAEQALQRLNSKFCQAL